jgi:hypothetical protein
MESNSRSLIVPKLSRTPRARGEVTGNGKLFERSWPSTTSISRTLPFPWYEHVADRRCKHQSHILRLPLSGKTAERTEAGACREITRTRSCRPADHVSSGWRNLECARDSPVSAARIAPFALASCARRPSVVCFAVLTQAGRREMS